MEFASRFVRRIADFRNLIAAANHIRLFGGHAAGPSGISIHDRSRQEIRNLARSLSRSITNGAIRCGSFRTARIPKTGGRRRLQIFELPDRVFQRAVYQILGPFLEPMLSSTVFATTGAGVGRAVAMAVNLMEDEQRWYVIAEDFADAFGSVPLGRLRSSLQRELPCDVIDTVLHSIPERPKGLPQGAGVSPLLLNWFVNHVLDSRWPQFDSSPLLRYVDDLLIPVRSEEELQCASTHLSQLLRPTGLRRKNGAAAFRRMHLGDSVEWLGFEFRLNSDETISIEIAEKQWQKLTDRLISSHRQPDGIHWTRKRIRGWIHAVGPAYAEGKVKIVYERIQRVVRETHVDLVLELEKFQEWWRQAFCRHQEIRARLRRESRRT